MTPPNPFAGIPGIDPATEKRVEMVQDAAPTEPTPEEQVKAIVGIVLAFVPFTLAYLLVGCVASVWWGGVMAWRDVRWRITGG